MNITVIGAGGVGGCFGGVLAKAGNNVTFIARGQPAAEVAADAATPDNRDAHQAIMILQILD